MTDKPTTPQERAELMRLHEAATPGEWMERDGNLAQCHAGYSDWPKKTLAKTAHGTFAWCEREKDEPELAIADMRCAAESRNALPRLIADVDRLEAENAALKARVEEAEKELRRELDVRFSPMGDNHHSALRCPYCNPERIDPAAEKATADTLRRELEAARGALERSVVLAKEMPEGGWGSWCAICGAEFSDSICWPHKDGCDIKRIDDALAAPQGEGEG